MMHRAVSLVLRYSMPPRERRAPNRPGDSPTTEAALAPQADQDFSIFEVDIASTILYTLPNGAHDAKAS